MQPDVPDKATAERLTRLEGREIAKWAHYPESNPDNANDKAFHQRMHEEMGDWHRCQLGTTSTEDRHFTVKDRKGRPVEYRETVQLFHLVAWGPNWYAAVDHYNKRKRTGQ